MSDTVFTVDRMKPPLCEICGTEANLNGGLVSFVPNESDLEWRERASEEPTMGHPPDSAWMCADHWPVANALAPFVTLNQGLAYTERTDALDDAQLARAVQKRREQGVEIQLWERVLRRLIPDLIVEAGGTDVEIEYVEQNTWWERDDSPPQVDEWAWAQQWANRDLEPSVCLYTHTAYWRSGGRARREAVLMVTPGRDDKRRWQVAVLSPVGSECFQPQHVQIEGEPSPIMRDLLATYGLRPAVSQAS